MWAAPPACTRCSSSRPRRGAGTPSSCGAWLRRCRRWCWACSACPLCSSPGRWRWRRRPERMWPGPARWRGGGKHPPRLGPRFVLTATAFLAPAAVSLATERLAGPRVALAYAVVMLGGWISLTIVGMMLKMVLPGLVPRVQPPGGPRAVPTLAELSWPRAEGLAYVSAAAGAAGRNGGRGDRGSRRGGAAQRLGAPALPRRPSLDICQRGPGRWSPAGPRARERQACMSFGRERITQALRTIALDPELGMSVVVDLGLIYEVEIEGGRVVSPVAVRFMRPSPRMGPASDPRGPRRGGRGSRRDLRSRLDAPGSDGARREPLRIPWALRPHARRRCPAGAVDLYDRRHTAA